MPRARKYPEELIERGVRLALESGRPVAAVARDLGVGHEVLRKRVRQAEADGGLRPDLPSTGHWLSRGRCQSTPGGLGGRSIRWRGLSVHWSVARDCPAVVMRR